LGNGGKRRTQQSWKKCKRRKKSDREIRGKIEQRFRAGKLFGDTTGRACGEKKINVEQSTKKEEDAEERQSTKERR
jgi:hypothetical protein